MQVAENAPARREASLTSSRCISRSTKSVFFPSTERPQSRNRGLSFLIGIFSSSFWRFSCIDTKSPMNITRIASATDKMLSV